MKITSGTKKYEIHNLNDKRQSTDTNIDISQKLKLSGRDFKAAITIMLKQITTFVETKNIQSQKKSYKEPKKKL